MDVGNIGGWGGRGLGCRTQPTYLCRKVLGGEPWGLVEGQVDDEGKGVGGHYFVAFRPRCGRRGVGKAVEQGPRFQIRDLLCPNSMSCT